MSAFAETSKLPKNDIDRFFLSEIHLKFMSGEYSANQFLEILKSQYRLELDFSTFCSIWNLVIGKPKDGIVDIVNELTGKFTLSICSNTDPIHWKYCCEQFTFLSNFQNHFLSFEIKYNKPAIEVFEHVLAILHVRGEECVFIDDSYPNIEAAKKLGFHTIHAEEPDGIRDELGKLNLL